MPTLFGERLAKTRKSKKITGAKLASMVGITQPYISTLENADTVSPNLELTKKIAENLGVSVDYLLGNTDDPAPAGERQTTAEEESNARFDPSGSSGRIIKIPVYGKGSSVCCGEGFVMPWESDEEPEEILELPKGIVGACDSERGPIVVYAEGDSMSNAGILDGAQVIINPAEPVYDGDCAFVMYMHPSGFVCRAIKRVYWHGDGTIELRSDCGDGWTRKFPPVGEFEDEERKVRIGGKITHVIWKPKRK